MRVPLGQTFTEAHIMWWRFLMDNKRPILWTAAVMAAVTGLLGMPGVQGLSEATGRPSSAELGIAVMALSSALTMFLSLFLLPFSVQLGALRAVRRTPPATFWPILNLFTRDGLRFAGRVLVVWGIMLAAIAPGILVGVALSKVDELAAVLAGFVLVLPAFWVGLRLLPWQATFADPVGTRLSDGWKASRGHVGYILWRTLLIPIPLFLTSAALSWGVTMAAGVILGEGVVYYGLAGATMVVLDMLPYALPMMTLVLLWRDLGGAAAAESSAPAADASFPDRPEQGQA